MTTTADPAPNAPSTKRTGVPSRFAVRCRISRIGFALRLLIVGGLLALTAWHATRDPDLIEATITDQRADSVSALRGALNCLGRRPGNVDAARIAARNLSQLLYPDEAETYYDRLRNRGRFDRDAAHARALGLTRSNRREQAAAAYESILKDNPDDSLALQRLAALQWNRGRKNEALEMAGRLSKTSSGAVNGHTILAEVYHDAGERDKAVVHFRRVLELDPELRQLSQPRLIFWHEFGQDLLHTGYPAEARRVLSKAVGQVDDPALMELLGRACFDEGDTREAEVWWQRAIEKAPERVGPWLLLARKSFQKQELDDALTYVARVLDIDPNHYVALSMASSAHRALGHTEEARSFQSRAAKARLAKPVSASGMGADAVPGTP
jgi:tetratricopeptide (TPR) repeat protein